MKATITCLGALLVAAALVSPASANNPFFPPCPQGPDMCGVGFYCQSPTGMVYGPNYCVRPPFLPFNGLYPLPHCGRPSWMNPAFPTHPYARSPRDYFMAE